MAIRTARTVAATLIAGLITLSVAGPALATNTVSQSIEPGVRSVSLSAIALSPVTSSGAAQRSTGMLAITVDDSTGTAAGWVVTVRSTSFVHTGRLPGSDLPASSFSLGTPGTPSVVIGQPLDPVNGPLAGRGGSLDIARSVIFANENHGMGTYTQSVPMVLEVPANAAAGTYTATLLVSFGSRAAEQLPIRLTVGTPPVASSPRWAACG